LVVAFYPKNELTNADALVCDIHYLFVLDAAPLDKQSELAIPSELTHLLVVEAKLAATFLGIFYLRGGAPREDCHHSYHQKDREE
tara:strand:- start:192 stop:446 length:255 start_codon:yes stop_codon:yes gene_type:complete